jgi:lipoprotein-anchoring transpeptidase ErfK/SrfK
VAAKKNKGKKNPTVGLRPGTVQLNDRWIDVDLSSQTVFAMQGDQVVNRFLVSTGRWPTVTVTGIYRVYVKYRAADMSGDDYYLPDVPYVMYFYKGYGLHGTYWHNNFGVPMSHGCVNLRTPDAGWLFDWASVGTVVSVHE